MSIECPECGERVEALPIHTCRKGGNILKELITLRDWHIKMSDTRVNRKKIAKHLANAYLIQAAITMIAKHDDTIATRDRTISQRDKIIASLKAQLSDGAQPFTDPDRKNTHSR